MPISYSPPGGGGGGSALNAASGTLTKIVPGAPATFTIVTADGSGAGTMTLTINGTPHVITFGNVLTSPDIATYSDDGTTLVNYDAATVSAALRGYLSGLSDITTGGSDPSLIVTTTGTGAGVTLDVSISGAGGMSVMYPSLPAPATGTAETGTRLFALAPTVSGKANRLHSLSYSVGGATAWATADAQIGYWDGSTFSPLLKIPLASLTGSAAGFNGAGGIALESMPNLITPVVGAALVARTAIAGAPGDETTGDDLTVYATYSTE